MFIFHIFVSVAQNHVIIGHSRPRHRFDLICKLESILALNQPTDQQRCIPMRNQQVARIYKIIKLLELNPQGLTVQQVYDKIKNDLEVEKRTIYRDLEAIEQSGFPLIQVPDSEPQTIKWKLENTMKVSKSLVLSPRELFALYLSKSALNPLKETPFYEDIVAVFNKIESTLGPKSLEFLAEISQTAYFEPKARWGLGVDPIVIDTVTACCNEGQRLQVDYNSVNSNSITRRTLEPHFIYFAKGSIYLVALDLNDSKVKVFSLPRMTNAEMLDQNCKSIPVNPDDFFQHSLGVFQQGQSCIIKLQFNPSVAAYVKERRFHDSQQVIVKADGNVELQLFVSINPELIQWVMGFGSAVKVLAPASLAEDIVKSAEKVIALYKFDKAA